MALKCSRSLLLTAMACACVVNNTAYGEPAPTSRPAESAAVKTIIRDIRQKREIPALSAAVVLDGKVVGAAATGVRVSGSKHRVTVNDRFHIGSCTKSMTATLCAMLVEDGTLRWDSTIAEVFPDLSSKLHADFRGVTLQQLLCHRSGLPEDRSPDLEIFPKLLALEGSMPARRQTLIGLAMGRPPASAPDSTFAYSNFGFAIAGAMAERAARQPYEALMTKRLFAPLGMKSAGFGAPGSAVTVDEPHGHSKPIAWYMPQAPGPGADNPPVIAPAGAAHMSIRDLATYAALHLDGARGKPRLLKAESFAKLHGDPYAQEYGFGWINADRPWAKGRILAHDGSNGRWYAMVIIAPRRNAAYVVATNAASNDAIEACRKTIETLRDRYPGPSD